MHPSSLLKIHSKLVLPHFGYCGPRTQGGQHNDRVLDMTKFHLMITTSYKE